MKIYAPAETKIYDFIPSVQQASKQASKQAFILNKGLLQFNAMFSLSGSIFLLHFIHRLFLFLSAEFSVLEILKKINILNL